MKRTTLPAAVLVTGTLLAGCASAGGNTGAVGAMGAGAMMGGASPGTAGYRYSQSTCRLPDAMAGMVVQVTLGDMGMSTMMGGTAPLGAHMMLGAAPSTVTAGRVSLVVSNMGWRTHELVIMPLAQGSAARTAGADGKVDEAGALGEASASCAAGKGEGIVAGSAGWVSLTLPAGHYELICNLPNHYADGMHQEFVISAAG